MSKNVRFVVMLLIHSRILLVFSLVIALFLSFVTPAFAATNLSWESLSPMPIGRQGAVGAAVGSKVYIIGGTNDNG